MEDHAVLCKMVDCTPILLARYCDVFAQGMAIDSDFNFSISLLAIIALSAVQSSTRILVTDRKRRLYFHRPVSFCPQSALWKVGHLRRVGTHPTGMLSCPHCYFVH